MANARRAPRDAYTDLVATALLYGEMILCITTSVDIRSILRRPGLVVLVLQVYVSSPREAPKHTVLRMPEDHKGGPSGERFAWYQCTVKGGREAKDIDAVQLAKVLEETTA